MPWKEKTTMSLRADFIAKAEQEGSNFQALCQEYGISRKTGYKWLKRYRQDGESGLQDRSRRPQHSPGQTEAAMEARVLEVREQHPAWGGRKIRKIMENEGHSRVPSASTITAILQRHKRIDPEEAQKHKPYQRFERSQPNELWQMDFKGYFALSAGGYCHPLTVLDDHSRFLVGLKACANETSATVREQLTAIFEHFGLPECMLMDNGSAWGYDRDARHTTLTAWLIRLGIVIAHGRPYHPQTQGKTERLNRTLLVEVIQGRTLTTLEDCQRAFDDWQQMYNFQRPHQALQLQAPTSRYQPSPRPFPTALPAVMYPADDQIRKVDISGNIYFQGTKYHISAAFRHQPVAIRPAQQDGVFQVFFCSQKVAQIDLRKHNQC